MTEPAMEATSPDPAIAAIQERSVVALAAAGNLIITNDAEFVAAGAFVTETIKPLLAEIEETWRPMQRLTKAAHQKVCEQRHGIEDPLLKAEKAVKGAIGAYDQRQKEIAAEAERARLADARRAAESKAVEEAARLESEGKTDAAAARLEEPVTPIVTTPAPERPTAAGISIKTKTLYRITDADAIALAYLRPDEVKIGKIVRAMGADAETVVGGIEVYEEPVVAAARR